MSITLCSRVEIGREEKRYLKKSFEIFSPTRAPEFSGGEKRREDWTEFANKIFSPNWKDHDRKETVVHPFFLVFQQYPDCLLIKQVSQTVKPYSLLRLVLLLCAKQNQSPGNFFPKSNILYRRAYI